jgi:hypothetical protein
MRTERVVFGGLAPTGRPTLFLEVFFFFMSHHLSQKDHLPTKKSESHQRNTTLTPTQQKHEVTIKYQAL